MADPPVLDLYYHCYYYHTSYFFFSGGGAWGWGGGISKEYNNIEGTYMNLSIHCFLSIYASGWCDMTVKWYLTNSKAGN